MSLSVFFANLSLYIYIYIYKHLYKRSLTGLNSEISFFLTGFNTKVEELSLPYNSPIASENIIEFTPFPRVLTVCEMQKVLSRIWRHAAVSI